MQQSDESILETTWKHQITFENSQTMIITRQEIVFLNIINKLSSPNTQILLKIPFYYMLDSSTVDYTFWWQFDAELP